MGDNRDHGERIVALETMMNTLLEERHSVLERIAKLERAYWQGIGILSVVALIAPILAKVFVK